MNKFLIDEQGMASVEYALLLGLIGMAIVGSLQVLGGNIFRNFFAIESVLSSVQFSEESLKSKQ